MTRLRHGDSKVNERAPEYTAWLSMRSRCQNPKNISYPNYGGRGIKVCPEWDVSYECFLEDVGRRSSAQHSLDRLDFDGDYEPGNVRWATSREQSNNRRNNRLFEHDGKRMTVPEWSRQMGIPGDTIWRRINIGWEFSRTITQPVRRQRNNTAQKRASNTRVGCGGNRFYTYKGKRRTLKEWSEETGIKYHTLYRRLVVYDWPVGRALTENVRLRGGT